MHYNGSDENVINITMLGTAALMPIPGRALTVMTLTCGGHTILFDCGEGTQSAARQAGVSLMKADIIALTHYHGDHIFGLPGLMQTMHSLGRTEPLYITGPEGLSDAVAPILKLTGWVSYDIRLLPAPDIGLCLHEMIPGWPDGTCLSTFQTAHRVPSRGYCFTLARAGKFLPEKATALNIPVRLWSLLQKGQSVQADGRVVTPDQVLGPARKGLKVVFTGDTALCDSLTDAARGADLLICEATYGENAQAQLAADHGHMNFAQAGEAAAKACVRRLWLTHYSQMIEDPAAFLDNAKAFFPDAECGEDGKTLTLSFDG